MCLIHLEKAARDEVAKREQDKRLGVEKAAQETRVFQQHGRTLR